MPGKLGFSGTDELVAEATAAFEAAPEEAEDQTEEEPPPSPTFMYHETLELAKSEPKPEPVTFTLRPSNAQEIFDILGTPQDRRLPLAPGSIFNTFKPGQGGQGAEPIRIRTLFKAPGTREILRLVVVPSHDAAKPEPEEASAYSLEELKKQEKRLGMGEFRGHYLLAKDGRLIPGRDIESNGNCWPGKNEKSLQIVLAGNGKSPTPEQRRTLFEYGYAMRRHYEHPLHGHVRDVVLAEGLLGIDPNGIMQASMANPSLIDGPLPAPKAAKKAG
jgi:hypothetical protein